MEPKILPVRCIMHDSLILMAMLRNTKGVIFISQSISIRSRINVKKEKSLYQNRLRHHSIIHQPYGIWVWKKLFLIENQYGGCTDELTMKRVLFSLFF